MKLVKDKENKLALTAARELAYDVFVSVMSKKTKPEVEIEELYGKNEKKLKRIDPCFCIILYWSQ